MKRAILDWMLVAATAAVLAVVLLGTKGAFAARPAVEARIEKLLPFVAAAMGEKIPSGRPRLVFMSHDRLQALPTAASGLETVAASKGGTIILDKTFTPGPATDWILVHELVHWMQFETQSFVTQYGGRQDATDTTCAGEFEYQAYHIADLWILAGNTGTLSDPLTVMMFHVGCQGF